MFQLRHAKPSCPHVSGIFFSANIFFADTKTSASTLSVFESFSAVHTYPIALVPNSLGGENHEMSMRIVVILASFLPRHSYCKVETGEACSLSLEKMSKSAEKDKKKYADTYKWTMMKLNYC